MKQAASITSSLQESGSLQKSKGTRKPTDQFPLALSENRGDPKKHKRKVTKSVT
jgi:hypothetical protein